jgi:hypothetical protein
VGTVHAGHLLVTSQKRIRLSQVARFQRFDMSGRFRVFLFPELWLFMCCVDMGRGPEFDWRYRQQYLSAASPTPLLDLTEISIQLGDVLPGDEGAGS